MDRRNYRGNMGRDCGCNGNRGSQYKPSDPVCGDVSSDYTSDDCYEKDNYENGFDRFPLGMCYVPWQHFRNLYENEFVALANGTLFKELDLDWHGRSCK